MMVPRWHIAGFLPPKPLTAAESTERNMPGFKDVTANSNTRDEGLMDSLVCVQPGAKGEFA